MCCVYIVESNREKEPNHTQAQQIIASENCSVTELKTGRLFLAHENIMFMILEESNHRVVIYVL